MGREEGQAGEPGPDPPGQETPSSSLAQVLPGCCPGHSQHAVSALPFVGARCEKLEMARRVAARPFWVECTVSPGCSDSGTAGGALRPALRVAAGFQEESRGWRLQEAPQALWRGRKGRRCWPWVWTAAFIGASPFPYKMGLVPSPRLSASWISCARPRQRPQLLPRAVSWNPSIPPPARQYPSPLPRTISWDPGIPPPASQSRCRQSLPGSLGIDRAESRLQVPGGGTLSLWLSSGRWLREIGGSHGGRGPTFPPAAGPAGPTGGQDSPLGRQARGHMTRPPAQSLPGLGVLRILGGGLLTSSMASRYPSPDMALQTLAQLPEAQLGFGSAWPAMGQSGQRGWPGLILVLQEWPNLHA